MDAAAGRARADRRPARAPVAESHTVVSAPPAASRSNGPVILRKVRQRVRDAWGVRPAGWVACTSRPPRPPAPLRAPAAARPAPACCARRRWSASTRREVLRVVRRAAAACTCRRRSPSPPAPSRSRSPSSSVISTGESTCSAIVISCPCGDSVRVGGIAPGVVDQHVHRVRRPSPANRRTSSRSAEVAPLHVAASRQGQPPLRISRTTLAPLSVSRTTRHDLGAQRGAAPRPSRRAEPAARPGDEGAACRPSRRAAGSAGHVDSRRRTAGPSLV